MRLRHGLYKVAPAVAAKIPHSRDIVGFRNILAHGYSEIDHNKVYDIAGGHAPAPLAAVREALKEFPEPAPQPKILSRSRTKRKDLS